jgi:hypothetical protein
VNYEDIMGDKWRAVISKAFQDAANEEAEKIRTWGVPTSATGNWAGADIPGLDSSGYIYIHVARQGGKTAETIAQMEADSKRMNFISLASRLGQIEHENPGIMKRLLSSKESANLLTLLKAK